MVKTYKPRKPATLTLTIQLEFEPNQLEQSFLQQAYAQLIPTYSRRRTISNSSPIRSIPSPFISEDIMPGQARVRGKAV
jgi:hypothetical protein